MGYKNLADMFFSKRKNYPSGVGYRFKKEGQWHDISYQQATDRVERIAAGLLSLGINTGDKVAILSTNRPEWAFIDYAALSIGAIMVPIYPTLLKEHIQYILNDSEAKVIFALNDYQAEKVNEVKSKLKHTKSFYIIDFETSSFKAPWKPLSDIEKAGETYLRENKDCVTASIAKVGLQDWATIIYTSGTTGEPKGTILTHNNLLSNVEAGLAVLEVGPADTFLSFLPLSHVFERMAGHFLATYASATIIYAESIDTVPQNMVEIKPTIMASVPRLYEKMYARVLENVELSSAAKRKIFNWAVAVGQVYISRIQQKKSISAVLQFQRNLAFKLVFSKLKEKVGGRIRFFVSGGAPLSQEIAEFFGAAGLIILEGYGLTETSPVIAVNTLDDFKFGTVGKIVPGVEVRIEEDGEISTRGPHLMVGYFKKEADTQEVLDNDGWFHTGDIGFVDEEGYLKITDRKKNIIVTAGGKNIAPQPIENIILTSKYIDQFLVIGDKRKFCSALLVCAEDPLKKWADAKDLKYGSYSDLAAMPEVYDLIREEIDRLSAGLASYETIKKFFIVPVPFSIETGEMTPKLSLKRKVILKNYAREIDAMYELKDDNNDF